MRRARERAELGPGAGNRSGDPSDRAKIFVMERKGKPSGAVRRTGIQYGLAQGIVRQKGQGLGPRSAKGGEQLLLTWQSKG